MKNFLRLIVFSFILIFICIVSIGIYVLFYMKLDLTVTCYGKAVPQKIIAVRPKIKGIIEKIFIKENQSIRQGDLICILSNQDIISDKQRYENTTKKILNDISRINARFLMQKQRYKGDILEYETKQNLIAVRLVNLFKPSSVDAEIKSLDNQIKALRIDHSRYKKELKSKEELYKSGITGKNELDYYKSLLKKINLEISSLKNDKISKAFLYKDKVNKYKSKKVEFEQLIKEYAAKQKKSEELLIKTDEAEKIELASYKNQLNEADSGLQIIKNNLEKLKIYAPISGYILTKDIDKLYGTSLREGDDIIEIGQLDNFIVEARLPEKKSSYIKNGMKVKIEFDAYPAKEYKYFKGKIINIAKSYDTIMKYDAETLKEMRSIMNKKGVLPSPEAFTVVKIDLYDKFVDSSKTIAISPNLSCKVDIIIEQATTWENLKKIVGRKVKGFTNFNLHL